MLRHAITSLLLVAAGLARAGLTDMRATIPGSLHQCEDTSVFFFDTQDSGSKTLLLVSPADASKLGSGTLSLTDALAQVSPLQKVEGISSADAAAFPFTLKVGEKVAFSTFGFLSNGQGKNMKLDRTVMSALPGASNCLAGAAAPAPAPAPSSSSSAPVAPPAPATTSAKPSTTPAAPATTSSPVYASRFVTSTRPASSASTTVPPTATAVSTSASLTLPPSSATNATAAAPASTAPVVIQAKYLLTSFVTISNESTTDGTVSSSPIRGGHITGSVNGTILPIGMALFTPNTTVAALNSTSATNVTASAASKAAAAPVLLSASYSFTMDNGESVFVVAQTPLSQNYSSEALLMTLQSSNVKDSQFANITILGKPEYINSTMFRIDAYYVNTTSIAV